MTVGTKGGKKPRNSATLCLRDDAARVWKQEQDLNVLQTRGVRSELWNGCVAAITQRLNGVAASFKGPQKKGF